MSTFRNVSESVLVGRLRALLMILLFTALSMVVCDLPGQQRPGKHADFSEGYRAFKKQDWKTVASRMLAALEHWPEDGETTRVYGRWFEPYLPHFYLGVALYELECYELSLDQFNDSVLSKEKIKGAKEELEELESRKLKSERLVRQGISEGEDGGCASWGAMIDQLKEREGS